MSSQTPSLGISICVVLYRAEEGSSRFHRELMASLRGFADCEVLYYDNSPTDALRAVVGVDTQDTRVTYVHDPRNLGFSFANNQLILEARQGKILLLNPDVYGFTRETWQLIASLDVAACVRFARLLNPDGSFQDCVGDVASLGRALRPRRRFDDVREPVVIGMGIMAFMLTSKPVYARVGLLDGDYRLYAEDMDWCHRATRAGFPCLLDPRIELTHTGGASAGDRWSRKASLQRKYLAERLFIDKHYAGPNWLAMRALSLVKRARVALLG